MLSCQEPKASSFRGQRVQEINGGGAAYARPVCLPLRRSFRRLPFFTFHPEGNLRVVAVDSLPGAALFYAAVSVDTCKQRSQDAVVGVATGLCDVLDNLCIAELQLREEIDAVREVTNATWLEAFQGSRFSSKARFPAGLLSARSR
jgi:hypothetical protein